MDAGGGASTGTHRLLALDGGGMRGAFSLGVLGVMERLLGIESGREERLRLVDYFDFIGGTSTGAIIATGLALGWSVNELKDKYRALGERVFQKRFLPLRLWSKYPGRPLVACLRDEFGSRRFNDAELLSLLMIVLHNRSTDSPWPLTNAPDALYNDGATPTHHNAETPLWQLLAAATAAPSFFPPVTLDFGAGPREFVDGGVTAHNNPALQLFLAATLPEYRVGWTTGADELLVVSVGTGSAPALVNDLSKLRRHLLYVATKTPAGLMFAASNHNDVMCRTLGRTRHGPWLDSELGEMVDGGLETKLFTYLRYNLDLRADVISGYGVSGGLATKLAKLDAVDHIDTLIALGERYADDVMSSAHFAGFPAR